MKARDEIRVQVLRLVKSALKNYEIEVKGDLSPQQVLAVLQKEAKKRQDSIEQYSAAGREDLVGQEEAELKIIQGYLPEQASESDLRKAVQKAVADLGDQQGAMGQIIGRVREEFSGAVDGALLAKIVREELANHASH
jgi:hypothetical protein